MLRLNNITLEGPDLAGKISYGGCARGGGRRATGGVAGPVRPSRRRRRHAVAMPRG